MTRAVLASPMKRKRRPTFLKIGRQAALLRLRREGIFRRRSGLSDLQAGGQRWSNVKARRVLLH